MSSTLRMSFAALAGALSLAARAEEPACSADAKRFCAGTSPTEVVSCLQAHRPDLAPACVQRLETVLVFLQNAALDCEIDAHERCKTAGPGMPMVECLRQHEGKLTRRCQDVFDTIRARDAALRRACGADVSRVCPRAPAGRVDLWMCLSLQGSNLSEACRSAL